MSIQYFDVSEDKIVDLTQETFDSMLNANRMVGFKIFIIKEISNLHVIRDKARIEELYKIVCGQ